MNNVLVVAVFSLMAKLRRREENACLPRPRRLRRDIYQRGVESTYLQRRKSSRLVGLDDPGITSVNGQCPPRPFADGYPSDRKAGLL